MNDIRLSVILGNYNYGKYIGETLASIVSQSWKPFEVIICDDASTDDSLEIIRRFTDKYSFMRLIQNETNLGTGTTYRRLTDAASGDYLYATGTDDKVMPSFFKKSIDILRQYPQAGVCSCLSFIIGNSGEKKGIITVPMISLKKSRYFPPEEVRRLLLRQGNWISGCSTIVRRDYLNSCGGYRAELYCSQDSFVYQALALKYGACFIPEPYQICLLNNYVVHQSPFSSGPPYPSSIFDRVFMRMTVSFQE